MKTSASRPSQVNTKETSDVPPPPPYRQISGEHRTVAAVLLLSLAIRVYFAATARLNPDEGFHFLFAHQPGLQEVRLETVTAMHTYPPLYVFLLHFILMAGQSEFLLRLPTLFFGTAFLAFAFLWTRQLFGFRAGMTALALLSFSPGLVSLGFEVRNYALFLAAMTVSLYGLERALEDRSAKWLTIAMLSEYVSILTNYSAIWFCAVLGVYILGQIGKRRLNARLTSYWALYQLGALGIYAWLYDTHIRTLRGSANEGALRTFLRESYYWPETDNPISFVIRQTVAVFRYLLELPPLAVAGALLFTGALAWLASGRDRTVRDGPARSLLLGLPLALGCATALAGLFPYGNSRHSALFQPFLAAGLGYAVARLAGNRKAVIALLSLAVIPWAWASYHRAPYIPGPAGSRQAMTAAVSSIRSLPKGSAVFTDHPGLIQLGYYLGSSVYSRYHARPAGMLAIQYEGYRVLCPCSSWTWDVRSLRGMLRDAIVAGTIPAEGVWFFLGDMPAFERELAAHRQPLRLENVSRFGASGLFQLRLE